MKRKLALLVVLAIGACSKDSSSTSGSGTAAASGSASGSASASASGSSSASDANGTAAAVGAGMDMLDQVAAALEPAADCPAKAKALHDWTAQHGDLMKSVKDGLSKYPQADVQREVMAQFAAHPKAKAMFAAAQTCATDKDFAAAWQAASAAFGS